MNVVKSAIITIIAKIRPDKIPKSYPIFKTTNSTNPRVFIKMPIDNESRQLSLVQRAANMLPPSLPATATIIIPKQVSQLDQSLSRPIWVRKPVNAKKSGSKAAELNDSSLSLTKDRKPVSDGITTPARKAPKRA